MMKPECVLEKHLKYLDALRERGVTNMFGAGPYLMKIFSDLNRQEAKNILSYWMETFSERHKSDV